MEHIKNSKAYDQFLDALTEARELNNRGYYTFFHGQQREYALLNDIGTELIYQLAELEKPKDFNFLRFRWKDFERIKKDSTSATQDILQEQKNLMRDTSRSDEASGQGENFLALNLFASGNVNYFLENTLHYVEQSFNWNAFQISSLYYMLNTFGIPPEITNKLRRNFIDLFTKEQTIYGTGRLILIAIPSNIVDERVYKYSTHHGGKQREPLSLFIENIFAKEHPFSTLDEFHCVMPMTPAGSLNPFNDIKIINFERPISQVNKNVLEKNKKELVRNIIDELEKAGKLKAMRKKAKDYLALLKKVHDTEEPTVPRKNFFEYWKRFFATNEIS